MLPRQEFLSGPAVDNLNSKQFILAPNGSVKEKLMEIIIIENV